jgi:hypothetical protein
MKLIKYLLILIILAVLLLSFTPLNLYYKYISKNIRPIQLEQISGSAVKGSTQNLKYMGMDVGWASWLIYPSSYNEVSVDFKLKDQLYDVAGHYRKKPDSQILNNVRGTLDWSLADNYINFDHGTISGYIKLDFDHIEMKGGVPYRVIGKVVTKELKLLKPIEKDLGEIEIVFTSDNPQIIVGQVNSRSNVLNVSGALYIHKNHRWELKLTLLPMAGEYLIERALQNIGDARSGGGRGRSLNLAGFY